MKQLILVMIMFSFLGCANSLKEDPSYPLRTNDAAGHCNKVVVQDGDIIELEGCFIVFNNISVMQNNCLSAQELFDLDY